MPTMSSDELIQPKVPEVVAIGQMEIVVGGPRTTQQLKHKEPAREDIPLPVWILRVGNPQPKSKVQCAHEERNRQPEVDRHAAHLGIERSRRRGESRRK